MLILLFDTHKHTHTLYICEERCEALRCLCNEIAQIHAGASTRASHGYIVKNCQFEVFDFGGLHYWFCGIRVIGITFLLGRHHCTNKVLPYTHYMC